MICSSIQMFLLVTDNDPSLLIRYKLSSCVNFFFPKVIIFLKIFITRRTILCLHVSGFQRQVFKLVKFLYRLNHVKNKEQKKNKGSVLVAETTHKTQNVAYIKVICKGGYLARFEGKFRRCNPTSTASHLTSSSIPGLELSWGEGFWLNPSA